MARTTLPVLDVSGCCTALGVQELDDSAARTLADAFKALGDPVRLQLLSALIRAAEGQVCACDLVEPTGKSQPTVSHHLKVLREAGLVSSRVEGRRRLYARDPRPLREVDDWLESYRDLWAQRFDALDTEIARGRRARVHTPTDGVPS